VARRFSIDGTTPLESPADLDGMVVAAVHGSTAHYNLFVVEEIFNIRFKEVVEVQSSGQLNDLWSRGQIDAAFCWEPSRSQLLAHVGSRELLTSDQLRGWNRLALDMLVGRREDAGDLRAVVEHMLRVIHQLNRMWMEVEANAFAYFDADEAAGQQNVCSIADKEDNELLWEAPEPTGYLTSIADAVNFSRLVQCEGIVNVVGAVRRHALEGDAAAADDKQLATDARDMLRFQMMDGFYFKIEHLLDDLNYTVPRCAGLVLGGTEGGERSSGGRWWVEGGRWCRVLRALLRAEPFAPGLAAPWRTR